MVTAMVRAAVADDGGGNSGEWLLFILWVMMA